MIIKHKLTKELNDLIKTPYEEEDYHEVVSLSLGLLEKELKEVFNLDLVKIELIDEILKDENNISKLNNLYSNLDKYTVKGILLYVKGLYLKYKEKMFLYDREFYSKEDINVIIYNINYVLWRLNPLRKKFDIDEFFDHIEDGVSVFGAVNSDYITAVPNESIADVVEEGIKRFNFDNHIFYEAYFHFLFERLNEDEFKKVYKIMSEAFKNHRNDDDLILYLSIFNGKHFKYFDEDVKINIETIIFNDFVKFKRKDYDFYNSLLSVFDATSFEYLVHFDKKKFTDELVKKMRIKDTVDATPKERAFEKIAKLNYEDIEESLLNYIDEMFILKDEHIIDYFNQYIFHNEDHLWTKIFKKYKGNK